MDKTKACMLVGSILWSIVCFPVSAQWSHQDIGLEVGWNAVYLTVQPVSNACETAFEGWPLKSVSLCSVSQASGQFVESPDEDVLPDPEYLVWHPGNPAASSLHSLIGGESYLIYSSNTFSGTLIGVPVVPRTTWIPATNAVNLVGFDVGEDADFSTFFDGSGLSITKVYQVGGAGDSPVKLAIGGFSGGLNGPIEPGAAYYIQCAKVSDYVGPFKVSPSGRNGLNFGDDGTFRDVVIKNESGAVLTATVQHVMSDALPGVAAPEQPVLRVFDVDQGWILFPLSGVQIELEPEESREVRFALDRTAMSSGAVYGSLLEISGSRGSLVTMAVSAEIAPAQDDQALWPAGLWVGEARLDQVFVVASNEAAQGGEAGGVLKYRLIVHVDVDGNSRLLQRAIVSGYEGADEDWHQRIDLDASTVPANAQSVRISSTAFSPKLNTGEGGGETGRFGDELTFDYAVGYDDPVNPFYHPYHPDHDGMTADYSAKAPSGDDLNNYIGEMKPETFSISNTISMVWSTNSSTSTGSALWNPEEKVSGSYSHTVHRLRGADDIRMDGTFTLRRVSQVGTLSINQ